MRILHVIPAVAPRYGGPSVAVVGLCRALGAAGHDTLIATTDADGPGRLPVPRGVEAWKGVPAVFFHRAFSESFKWSGPLATWLDREARRFDLVHVHAVFSHSSIAAGRAARAAGRPYLVRPLGALDPWSMRRHRYRKAMLMQLGAARLLRGASALHYTTDEERDLAEAALHRLPRAVVVPLGVDAEFFEAPARDEERAPYILTLSRLDRKKRLEDLIDAFHALGTSAGQWSLVIAGDGEAAEASRLRERVARGPARDRIRFTGWLEGTSKVDLLRGASLFAVPSHQENFGIALAEALACGVPAVTTPGVNLGSAIVNAGAGWRLDDDAATWPASLTTILADRRELAGRRGAARSFASRFRWDAVAAAMVTAYERVLGTVASAPVAGGARRVHVGRAGGGD